jgi:ribosomal protein L11 methyltransferase
VEQSRFNDTNREYIEQLIGIQPNANLIQIEEVQEQNWNESWERTIQPQRIGSFYVKPTWSRQQPGKDDILLEIDPKMAFGTGYHATTRLMLNSIQKMALHGRSILDAGTGTGILAIAAVKLGAGKALGFDTDIWSKQNAEENILINGVKDKVEIRHGSIKTVHPDEIFDVTLANINRNEILEMLEELVKHTSVGGNITLSGLLAEDYERIDQKAQQYGLELIDMEKEADGEDHWIVIRYEKNLE